MAPIVHSVEIDRRPEEVFAYVTDPSHFTEWQAAVVSAHAEGSGPLQQGSRMVMTRRMGKREQTMTSEYTEYDSPRSYAFRVLDGPVRALGKGSFEPLGDGDRTRFTFDIDFEGHGIGKLLVPLVVRRQAQKELAQSHQDLKRTLENNPQVD
ncbi:MAG: SRPBCC family protein [Acidobacteria bacterium]|nr:SRPBCC family protein [Acidobacteriota bacterium]